MCIEHLLCRLYLRGVAHVVLHDIALYSFAVVTEDITSVTCVVHVVLRGTHLNLQQSTQVHPVGYGSQSMLLTLFPVVESC